MSIDWMEDVESNGDELPWLRDYIEAGGDYDTPVDVCCCVVGLKGVLILTDYYKAFVFKGSKLFGDLIEALPIYVGTKTGNPVLVACGTDGGKVKLGLDQLRLEAVWRQDKKAYFQIVKTSAELAETRMKKQNSLLPTTMPTSTNSKKPASDPSSKNRNSAL